MVFIEILCCVTLKLYICTMFFMVLDLRLTKIGCRETAFFFINTSQ